MNKRAQQARATKQKILDAAEKLVSERGFENVSVSDITAHCGIGHGTFYHYFKSMEELSIYLMRTPYEYLQKKYQASSSLPSLERLRIVLYTWFSIGEKFNLHLTRKSLQLYPDEASRGEYGGNATHMDLGMEQLRQCLTDAVEQGALKADAPIEELSMEILFCLQGCMLYQCKYPDTFHVMQWADYYINRVFHSVLAPYIP